MPILAATEEEVVVGERELREVDAVLVFRGRRLLWLFSVVAEG